jgi:hypothetical protein
MQYLPAHFFGVKDMTEYSGIRKAQPTNDLWLHIAKGAIMTMQQVKAIEAHRADGGRGYKTKWLDKEHIGHGKIEYLPRG